MIDDIDRKIILALSSNPRASFREIARKIGLSTGTVISRIEDMREKGIIRPSLILDFKKLNLNLAFFEIHGNLNIDELEDMENLIFIMKLNTSIIAGFSVRDEIDILHIAKKIKTLPNVEKVDVKLVKEFSLRNNISECLLNIRSNK